MSSSSILLQGGTVLQHGDDDTISAVSADVLVEGNTIFKIAPGIHPPSPSTKIIDCHNKIIAPGCIDTHRHLWQTQLKGRHADALFMQYMVSGNSMHSKFSPEAAALGVLAGALESIDAGTTTIVDHAHIATSPEHMDKALGAIEDSGIRAVYCPSVVNYVNGWEPNISFVKSPLPDWFLSSWEAAADRAEKTNGRVHVGLAFDAWNLPPEEIKGLFEHIRSNRIPAHLITSHRSRVTNPVTAFKKLDTLGKELLISHPNEFDSETVEIMKEQGIYGSTTPATELQMGIGRPSALQADLYPLSSLGVDCHSATSASIIDGARLLLQWARAAHHAPHVAAGRPDRIPGIGHTAAQAFNLATVHGARAARLGAAVGRVAVGCKADLVVWHGRSPAMACAARHNPVAAIVLHSSPRDVDAVIVDGVLRKEGGELLPVMVGGRSMSWDDISKELDASYESLQAEIEKLKAEDRLEEYIQWFTKLYSG